ncbi:response regulator receiver-modulated signal transduction phosphohydrolase [Oleiphilus messinensis]|uniref:Response regulator receiver-modulated signal transduction phosphohydrolase n=1 Tax=Oleiphilus messinensis TaxID=141451 RepID=A0A1Y0IEX4_9GAMM|nr:HD domain-containing phosphohydrolase [Oleiphilus messinensis]ARU58025.1 response regulator receiver-modulated signal transduction phosphohydrolase [Oleiphilus messinensis]
MNDSIPGAAKILIVDDEPDNLRVMMQILQDDYQLYFAKDGEKALELVDQHVPDLVLMDVMMPKMDGFETCIKMKERVEFSHIPVIFVTAMAESSDESYGLQIGGVDYITKPINGAVVKARVKTHLSLVSVKEVEQTRLEVIRRLGRAAEYKDNETGLHVIRMSHFSRLLAVKAGFSENEAELILHASPMHDVGKIGIPDRILLKPGKLDSDEWEIMKQHPLIGAQIIGKHRSRLLMMAHDIALNHHEKWDGTGYPNGLSGYDIPRVARVVAIADVFDALTTERPYKHAWSVEDALKYLNDQRGVHLDPDLVPLFVAILPEVMNIKERWGECANKEDLYA